MGTDRADVASTEQTERRGGGECSVDVKSADNA